MRRPGPRELKGIENRKWAPSRALIGQTFALHASLGWDQDAVPLIESITERPWPSDQQPRGKILGVARLVGFVRMPLSKLPEAVGISGERAMEAIRDPWFFGPVGLVLADVRRLDVAVPAKGALNFWEVPPAVEAAIRSQL